MCDDGKGRELDQTDLSGRRVGNRSNGNGIHVMGGAEMMSKVALWLSSTPAQPGPGQQAKQQHWRSRCWDQASGDWGARGHLGGGALGGTGYRTDGWFSRVWIGPSGMTGTAAQGNLHKP